MKSAIMVLLIIIYVEKWHKVSVFEEKDIVSVAFYCVGQRSVTTSL